MSKYFCKVNGKIVFDDLALFLVIDVVLQGEIKRNRAGKLMNEVHAENRNLILEQESGL